MIYSDILIIADTEHDMFFIRDSYEISEFINMFTQSGVALNFFHVHFIINIFLYLGRSFQLCKMEKGGGRKKSDAGGVIWGLYVRGGRPTGGFRIKYLPFLSSCCRR